MESTSDLVRNSDAELKFLASRNRLKIKLEFMLDFVRTHTPEEIGQQRYENLREVAALGLMLIMENDWQHRQIQNLRKDLAEEMRMNTTMLAKLLDTKKEDDKS